MRRRLTPLAVAAMILSGILITPAYAGAVNADDAAFLKASHQGNLAEIATAQDARKHATTECVEQVAEVLERDHSKLDANVKALASKLGINLPGSPTPEQQNQLSALEAKAGTPAYDAASLKAQEANHTATLARIDMKLSTGRNAEVKAAARSTRPVVEMHLDMVRGGTCRAGKDAGMVRAGSGGHLAVDDGSLTVAGLASLAGGGLLAAAGGVWLVRNRRRSAERR